MKKILNVKIGDEFGDLECIDIIIKKGKYCNNKYYKMKCKICGRTKDMLSSTIRNKKGITHKSCGQGLKTKDTIFYDRWCAMRTRTTNNNYEHYDCYENVNSDEFELFIDFYDAMYKSFLELSNKIGKENTSLERININDNYTKDNCKWIHKKDQPKNTRRIVKFLVIFPDGHQEIHSNVREFAYNNNLNPETIYDVLNGRSKTHRNFKFKRI